MHGVVRRFCTLFEIVLLDEDMEDGTATTQEANNAIVMAEESRAAGATGAGVVSQVTVDHKYMVFGVDTSGSEQYELYVESLETRKRAVVSVDADTGGYGVWAADNRTLFYTTKVFSSLLFCPTTCGPPLIIFFF